jgi:hypothetical protein
MMPLLLTSTFLLMLGFCLFWVSRYMRLNLDINETTGFKVLIAWIILGFFTTLDNTHASGCVVLGESILAPRNILFSACSFFLIIGALKEENRKKQQILFGVELAFWIAKLFLLKGGYVVGYGGDPDPVVVFYDLVALLIRLFILGHVLFGNQLTFFKIGATAFIIILIKVLFFSFPWL